MVKNSIRNFLLAVGRQPGRLSGLGSSRVGGSTLRLNSISRLVCRAGRAARQTPWHLSTEEHGAYLLLMFNYWQTGRPIPKNRLAKIARLSNDRWIAVESSLKEFFNDNGTEWSQERIERDLEAVKTSISQKSAAGKASAEARKAKKSTNGPTEWGTGVQRVLIHRWNRTTTETQLIKDPDTDLINKTREREACEPGVEQNGKSPGQEYLAPFGKFSITPEWHPGTRLCETSSVVGHPAWY
ncbi:Uncharacterized protein conserved in bacteria [Kluyvera cryocrescens]|uniref:Uncharacterized protein conserved in bacteria n=1 Tax=Kluyvera cryocrescens TaxID=580 RepID=A0A485CX48_KLUCR|nr:Uncharacterized protein conserved in bacteria [Kluyvera cryocrescens]